MSLKIGKYIIEEDIEFGRGGYGSIYLAKDGEEEGEKKHLYVIKVPLEGRMTGEDKTVFNNEIDILNILSQIPDNKYTSIIYNSQKFDEGDEIPYYAMPFFSKGLLFDYVFSGSITERLAKYIFRKIILGFQFLHNNGICHLDVKIENSENYATPEIWKKEKLNGEKADIFSLGVVLFLLVNKRYGFDKSKKTDKYYGLIVEKKYEEYWKKLKLENLSDDFKNLYLKMVAFEPGERPTFDEILNNVWLKEVSNLTQDEENKIKKELKKKYATFKSVKEIIIEEKIETEDLITRSGGNDGKNIFKDHSLKPKKISNNRLIINKSIKINGNIKEVEFMNFLAKKIIEKYKDNCFIEASKKDLKFEMEFDNEGEEEEKAEKEEKEEENAECKMVVELFKYEEGGYLLEFRRTGGKIPEYYKHFSELEEIITKMKL